MDIPSNHPLQLASEEEHARLAPVLARAFAEDPVFNWMFPDPASRGARMERLFNLLLRLDDSSARILRGGDFECVSIWQPPGTAGVPFPTIARNLHHLLGIFGRRILRSLAVSNAIEAHYPEGDFWYAHFVGVEPAMQGHGWGYAMMQEGLQFAARDGLPTYLETARPSNVAFYEGMGFRTIGEWNVPRGPHFWSLLHRP